MCFPNAECTELGNVLSRDVLWLPLASSESELVGHGQTAGHAVVFLRFGLKYRFFSPHPTPFLFHGLLLILHECLLCVGALSAWTSSPQARRANHSSRPLPRYRLLHETDPDSPASDCSRDSLLLTRRMSAPSTLPGSVVGWDYSLCSVFPAGT